MAGYGLDRLDELDVHAYGGCLANHKDSPGRRVNASTGA